MRLTHAEAEAISIAMAELERREGNTPRVQTIRAVLNRYGF